MTNADIRSYYIRPPLVNSWITEGGARFCSPMKKSAADVDGGAFRLDKDG